MTDEECVMADPSGKPRLPDLLREGEAARLLALMPTNRCNYVAMRIQMIVETNRRAGNISERAAFEAGAYTRPLFGST
jgi:putative membrane protein